MEIRKYYTLITSQKLIDISNNFKIFLFLAMIKDLIFRAKSVTRLYIALL